MYKSQSKIDKIEEISMEKKKNENISTKKCTIKKQETYSNQEEAQKEHTKVQRKRKEREKDT